MNNRPLEHVTIVDGLLSSPGLKQARGRWHLGRTLFAVPLLVGVSLAACQPTVKIEAPDRPIEINLNVKIEHEIRVKVDRELDDLLASNPELF